MEVAQLSIFEVPSSLSSSKQLSVLSSSPRRNDFLENDMSSVFIKFDGNVCFIKNRNHATQLIQHLDVEEKILFSLFLIKLHLATLTFL
jgi:hypothetical protein